MKDVLVYLRTSKKYKIMAKTKVRLLGHSDVLDVLSFPVMDFLPHTGDLASWSCDFLLSQQVVKSELWIA